MAKKTVTLFGGPLDRVDIEVDENVTALIHPATIYSVYDDGGVTMSLNPLKSTYKHDETRKSRRENEWDWSGWKSA